MDDTHQIYLELTKQYTKGKVLKTDVWNELMTDYPIKADQYIELDEDMYETALRHGLPVVYGDIRQLPFKTEFDTVIDLSTIDHIEDYESALKEYHRVLKPNGRLLLVVWVGNKLPEYVVSFNSYQYYFSEKDFDEVFNRYFTIKKNEPIPGHYTINYYGKMSDLKFYYGVKK